MRLSLILLLSVAFAQPTTLFVQPNSKDLSTCKHDDKEKEDKDKDDVNDDDEAEVEEDAKERYKKLKKKLKKLKKEIKEVQELQRAQLTMSSIILFTGIVSIGISAATLSVILNGNE